MSQYPSPYTPPPWPQNAGYYPPPADLLAPARWASLMMFVLGIVGLLFGSCLVMGSFAMANVNWPADQENAMRQMETMMHAPRETIMFAAGIVFLGPSLLLIVLGFFVRRGGRKSIIASCALTAVIVTWLLINALGALLRPAGSSASAGICFGVVGMIIFGFLLSTLIAAARSSRAVEHAQRQYAAQYWQYQQAMQMYQNGGQHPGPPAPPSGVPDDRYPRQ